MVQSEQTEEIPYSVTPVPIVLKTNSVQNTGEKLVDIQVEAKKILETNFLMNLEDFYIEQLEKSCRNNFDSFVLEDKE
jgi:hypothetical protein